MSMAIDGANLGYAVKNSSDIIVIDSNLSDVQSDIIIIQSDVKTVLSNIVSFRSDIIATTDSDLVTILSNITSFRSDIVATTDSDIVVIQSDLLITKNKIVSDIATLASDIIATTDSNIIVIQSDLKIVKSNLSDVQSDIIVLLARSTVVSTASATTTGVIVQDGTSGTPNTVELSTGGVNAFGAWLALDASTAADIWISHITTMFERAAGDSASGHSACVEIGTGGAGAETTKIRFSWYTTCREVTAAGIVHSIPIVFALSIPIKVVSGTRIAARASSSKANANIQVGLSMYQSLET